MDWIRRLTMRLRNALWRVDATVRSSPTTERSSSTTLPFQQLKKALRQAVASGNREESEHFLEEIRRVYPVPAVDILPKDVWGLQEAKVIFRTHGRFDIKDAVANVKRTGRSVSSDDEALLQLIMSHWCAWSPTVTSHQNDPWMHFLRRDYPQLKGLEPILDTLIWPEEIACYPPGHGAIPPWLFLLATRDMYYVYNLEDITMFKVGPELNDVIDGLRKERWREEFWEIVENATDENPKEWFPTYDNIS